MYCTKGLLQAIQWRNVPSQAFKQLHTYQPEFHQRAQDDTLQSYNQECPHLHFSRYRGTYFKLSNFEFDYRSDLLRLFFKGWTLV